MNMKKIYENLLLVMVACLPFFTSCEDDNGSNPTLTIPASFVLNTPEFGASNVYDLPASSELHLTTSQPDYGGWPAAVTYMVQISLDQIGAGGWTELSTAYTSTEIAIAASELNTTILDLYRAANDDADPEGIIPLSVRLRAYLADSDINNFGEVYSNAISLNVLSYDTPSDVTLPEQIVVCGNSIADAWSTWKPVAPVYGKEGRFYTMIYNDADGFKWGYKANDWFGYSMITEFDNQVEGLTISADGDGNIVFDKAGWYVLEFITKIVGPEVQVKLVVAPGAAGVRGACAGGDWDSDHLMTPSTGKDGDWTFVSEGSGELRAYIIVPGEDWWRTEFTLYQGADKPYPLYFRDFDIPGDWASSASEKGGKDDPDNYSVSVITGQTLKVNFDRNTGSVE